MSRFAWNVLASRLIACGESRIADRFPGDNMEGGEAEGYTTNGALF
jgi:hypothetical protein